jgi:NAD(P)-dependent dehydrogenase (short-subunit alcohol dehydrogenase family)
MLSSSGFQHLLIQLKVEKMSKKIVLITGTNSGFGWLTAHSAAAAGHQVYATMRDTQGRNADKAQALEALENVTVLDVTLTDDDSVKQAVETILAKEGAIDVLVNNAGYAMGGVAESFTAADVHTTFNINVYAPWRLIKQVLPAMRKQADGLIINVTSGFGRVSFPFATIYAASKFALEGISEGLHYEVKRLGIDVVVLEPGAFPTEMQQKNNPASDQAVSEGYGAIADIPNKMIAALGGEMEAKNPDPQDVADAIVKLIDTPKGTRPLRTVVDPITGQFIEAANQAVAEQFAKGLTTFGMGELL